MKFFLSAIILFSAYLITLKIFRRIFSQLSASFGNILQFWRNFCQIKLFEPIFDQIFSPWKYQEDCKKSDFRGNVLKKLSSIS